MRYMHGGDIYSNPEVSLDFSVNLNPLGLPDFVKTAAMESIAGSGRYPDPCLRALAEAAAAFYGVGREQIIFGNGAAELIFRIVRARSPKRAVLTAPAFAEYEAALRSVGAETEFYCLREDEGFALPAGEYLEFLNRVKPELIFICNPANPTGAVCRKEELKQILDFCSEQGILAVVDECFLDFMDRPACLSALPWVRRGRTQIFVLKALTKSFAMAGLRFGCGFSADTALLEAMQGCGQPWSVSVPAEAAAAAVFAEREKSEAYLRETRALLGEEKSFLSAGLCSAGFKVYAPAANFLFFCDLSGRPPGALYEHLLSKGILIRSCADYRGLNGSYYRICIRRHEENVRLLKALRLY